MGFKDYRGWGIGVQSTEFRFRVLLEGIAHCSQVEASDFLQHFRRYYFDYEAKPAALLPVSLNPTPCTPNPTSAATTSTSCTLFVGLSLSVHMAVSQNKGTPI